MYRSTMCHILNIAVLIITCGRLGKSAPAEQAGFLGRAGGETARPAQDCAYPRRAQLAASAAAA